MARCQCAGSSCSCLITAGPGVTVQGVGSADQPYVVGLSTNFYQIAFAAGAPTYYVNAPGVSDVGARAVFVVEINAATTAFIYLPDGSTNAPYPPLGSEIEFFVNGANATTSVPNWGGAVITWHGTAPGASKLGWYRFVFLGTRWAGIYLGNTYLP